MTENLLIAVLGGGNLILFIKFLIERHDAKKEKAEAKKENEKAKTDEANAIKDQLRRLEKDGVRTQLLLLILMEPDDETEILRIAEHYFVKLKANWYMTGLFARWCDKRGLEPDWFNKDN